MKLFYSWLVVDDAISGIKRSGGKISNKNHFLGVNLIESLD